MLLTSFKASWRLTLLYLIFNHQSPLNDFDCLCLHVAPFFLCVVLIMHGEGKSACTDHNTVVMIFAA